MLGRDDVVKLVRAVAQTREIEIGCDECFDRLDGFAEAGFSGVDASAAMPLVRDHLDKCADCRGEFEALLRALRAT
ncbi:MAG TPA: hypothetical protein VF068_13625 [Rubrobacter sp.]